MASSCRLQDAVKLEKLYRKHVGSGPLDFTRLREVIRRETSAAERGTVKVSRGLLRELRNDRATVGRLLRRCG